MSAFDFRPMPRPSRVLQQAVSDLDALIARTNAARGVVPPAPYTGPERRRWRAQRQQGASMNLAPKRTAQQRPIRSVAAVNQQLAATPRRPAPKRVERGAWITRARAVGIWLLRVWVVVGWLLFVPAAIYLWSAQP